MRFEIQAQLYLALECTYLYLSCVFNMDLVDVGARRDLCDVFSMYPGADIHVFPLQKPSILLNIKVSLRKYRSRLSERTVPLQNLCI